MNLRPIEKVCIISGNKHPIITFFMFASLLTFHPSFADYVEYQTHENGELNCQVEGKTGENPSKCLAFSTNLSEKPYNDLLEGIGCCWTALSNSDIPEDSPLKSVVNIDSDGSM